jgi:hypothetical protein
MPAGHNARRGEQRCDARLSPPRYALASSRARDTAARLRTDARVLMECKIEKRMIQNLA